MLLRPVRAKSVLPLVLVAAAGGALAAVALRAPEPTYVPPAEEPPPVVPARLAGEAPPGFAVRALDVEGMCCGGCAAKLHEALLAVPGVREAAVDPVLGAASAIAPEGLAPERLAAALTFEKYVARARESSP